MSINLYIVRHGRVITDETSKRDYLHLSNEGTIFGSYLDNHFKDIYFDHIFYQSKDVKTSDPYNRCKTTIQGMKGIKTEFDKTHLSRVFEALNKEDADVRNIMICFKADAFNVISNIINPQSDEEFSKDYHRVFHYEFNSNNYYFVSKISADESQKV